MLDDVTSAILQQLTTSCTECDITSDIIDREHQSVVCVSKFPISVTYRARLRGTSETDSGSLISLIEEWVSGGASINVTGLLMTANSECSVAISSVSRGECHPPTTDPTTDHTTDPTTASATTTTDNMAGIIGGSVVAVILIITVAVTITISCICCGNKSVNKHKK